MRKKGTKQAKQAPPAPKVNSDLNGETDRVAVGVGVDRQIPHRTISAWAFAELARQSAIAIQAAGEALIASAQALRNLSNNVL